MIKQYGIIYKFTIVAKLKMDGQRPFYIGQHITTSNAKEFLSRDNSYWGSGSIWGDFLNKLKELNPNNWQMFIKREILFSSDKVTQKGLDAMEAYYIKREKSHYSFGIGGCNVLWGAAIVGDNPAKDERVRNKMSLSKKRLFNSTRGNELRKIISERAKRKYQKENNPTYGTRWITNGIESKRIKSEEKIPNGWQYGNSYVKEKNNPMSNHIFTKEERQRLSEIQKKINRSGENNPMYGKVSSFKGKKHTEEVKKILSEKAKEQFKRQGHPSKGRHLSEETKEKIRKSALLRYRKKVI